MITNITIYGSIFALSLDFQHPKGYTPTETWFGLLPFTVIMIGNLANARLAKRFSPGVRWSLSVSPGHQFVLTAPNRWGRLP